MDQPTRLSLASAGSAAVKPGPSNEVRLPYCAIIRRDLHQQPHDHELQLPYPPWDREGPQGGNHCSFRSRVHVNQNLQD